MTWCWWLAWYFCAWVPRRCGVGSYEQTSPSPRVWRLLHIQQDSRILMPCIHGVSNLEHSARSKQSFTSTTNSFLSSSVVVSGRKQASRRYSLTSRTPCPCAIHGSKRNTPSSCQANPPRQRTAPRTVLRSSVHDVLRLRSPWHHRVSPVHDGLISHLRRSRPGLPTIVFINKHYYKNDFLRMSHVSTNEARFTIATHPPLKMQF